MVTESSPVINGSSEESEEGLPWELTAHVIGHSFPSADELKRQEQEVCCHK